MHTAIRLVAALLVAVLATGCADYGDSVKILTFNVQFLPASDDDETRSVAIARRIKAVDYDIVVLNEVFDEEARDKFVAELGSQFPSYVAYLGDDAVGSQDSGLMLFSRFPFEPLPDGVHRVEADDVEARNAGADWKDVGFIEYDDDVFPDNWAAKGAAFVRIRNPNTPSVYNIAFTHMQASYPEDEDDQEEWLEPIDARTGQFRDLRAVIQESLVAGQLTRENVFVLGDLNVDGDLADTDLGTSGYDQPNLYEWALRFSRPGSFFTDVLKDAWANEQSPRDRGLTNLYHWGPPFSPDQGARLDYFLRNRTTNDIPTCVQHMTLAHNMRDGTPTIESGFGLAGPDELSDHIGINIDLNLFVPGCDPGSAHTPPLELPVSGTLQYPGSVQWYRFDEAGTYAFVVDGAGIDYRVYAAADMSTPVPQYYAETITFSPPDANPVTGKKYAFPDPPYFVKVFHRNRAATGTYQLVAHRATCSSMEEACLMFAHRRESQSLPGAPINADDTAWYELHTESADSGMAQDLRLFVDNYAPDALKLRLLRDDGATVLAQDVTADPDPSHPGRHLLEIPTGDRGPSKLYLNVQRRDLALTSYDVGWETNLTILHGQSVGVPGAVLANLYCVVETDGIADIDEVWLTIEVDGTKVVDDVYIGDYDNGSYRTMEDYLRKVSYLEEVKVTLRDEDGGFSGDDDFLVTTIGPLPAGTTQKLNETSVLACCDGEYLLRYNRSRSLQR